LEQENARLQLQIIELQQKVLEAEVLSTLVDYARSRVENRYIAAGVIGYDTNPFMRYVIINRGSDDDIRTGMPVVTNLGLVGQVVSLNSVAARVRLITDPGSVVDVHLQQANVDAILSGDVTGEVNLDMIPQTANVQPGDLILTSGLGGNYPPNIVVGQVSTVRKRDFDLFQSASVQLAVNFSEIQVVLLISNFLPVDTSTLLPTPVP
jgi:rod shape-determining protein MreC